MRASPAPRAPTPPGSASAKSGEWVASGQQRPIPAAQAGVDQQETPDPGDVGAAARKRIQGLFHTGAITGEQAEDDRGIAAACSQAGGGRRRVAGRPPRSSPPPCRGYPRCGAAHHREPRGGPAGAGTRRTPRRACPSPDAHSACSSVPRPGVRDRVDKQDIQFGRRDSRGPFGRAGGPAGSGCGRDSGRRSRSGARRGPPGTPRPAGRRFKPWATAHRVAASTRRFETSRSRPPRSSRCQPPRLGASRIAGARVEEIS